MSKRLAFYVLMLVSCVYMGCANVSAPTGGKRDKTPPKLVSVSPADSLKNSRVKRIELNFDEYVTVSDAQKEVVVMPLLPVAPIVTGINKKVTIKLVDSLLEPNTTYRISFGNAIKDLHEGNVFSKYTYTFSTGSYFDSLELKGNVLSAASGLPDTSSVAVVLYDATAGDSAIFKKKPRYMVPANNKGEFVFKGLPARPFRIYAIKDANTNLIYDGDAETVAFSDSTLMPGIDTVIRPVTLRLFAEIPDTSKTATKKKEKEGAKEGNGLRTKELRKAAMVDTNFSYTTNLDTASLNKRSFDINNNIKLNFTHLPVVTKDKISLTYDSAGISVTAAIDFVTDTLHPNLLQIKTHWQENRIYRLHLAYGFVKDTGGRVLPGAKFAFRTNSDDDYGKITVNLPAKYYGQAPDHKYLLMVKADEDTAYLKPIYDTVVNLNRLRPGVYTFRVIHDRNKNGKWDTGDLLGRRQPEEVIPSSASVKLKTGYEHIIDFEEKQKPKPVLKKAEPKPAAPKK